MPFLETGRSERPETKDDREVLAVDDAVEGQVRDAVTGVFAGTPETEHDRGILSIDEAILVDVTVQPSGCLGNCSQAPNALLVTDADERMFARRCALSDSAEVVERASGVAPSMDDADMVARLQRARRLRVRMEAREESGTSPWPA